MFSRDNVSQLFTLLLLSHQLIVLKLYKVVIPYVHFIEYQGSDFSRRPKNSYRQVGKRRRAIKIKVIRVRKSIIKVVDKIHETSGLVSDSYYSDLFLERFMDVKSKYKGIEDIEVSNLTVYASDFSKSRTRHDTSVYINITTLALLILTTSPFILYEFWGIVYPLFKNGYIYSTVNTFLSGRPYIYVSIGFFVFGTLIYQYAHPVFVTFGYISIRVVDTNSLQFVLYRLISGYFTLLLVVVILYDQLNPVPLLIHKVSTVILGIPVFVAYMFTLASGYILLLFMFTGGANNKVKNVPDIIFELLGILDSISEKSSIRDIDTKEINSILKEIKNITTSLEQVFVKTNHDDVVIEEAHERVEKLKEFLYKTAYKVKTPHVGSIEDVKKRLIRLCNSLLTNEMDENLYKEDVATASREYELKNRKYSKMATMLFLVSFISFPVFAIYIGGEYLELSIPDNMGGVLSIFYIFWSAIGIGIIIDNLGGDIKEHTLEILSVLTGNR